MAFYVHSSPNSYSMHQVSKPQTYSQHFPSFIFLPSPANPVEINFINGTQVSVIAGSGDSQICAELTVNSNFDNTIGDRVVMVNYTMNDTSATGMVHCV